MNLINAFFVRLQMQRQLKVVNIPIVMILYGLMEKSVMMVIVLIEMDVLIV